MDAIDYLLVSCYFSTLKIISDYPVGLSELGYEAMSSKVIIVDV